MMYCTEVGGTISIGQKSAGRGLTLFHKYSRLQRYQYRFTSILYWNTEEYAYPFPKDVRDTPSEKIN
jgi:hypothetical protein